MFIAYFFYTFRAYLFEIIPPLAAGFLISGIISEFIPTDWVERHLGQRGFRPLLYATVLGAIAPVCCWGSLPIAVSFYKKGASLGTIFAFLVATPATSISAIFVSWRFMGWWFTLYMCAAVIVMGLIMGLIGNLLGIKPRMAAGAGEHCEHCDEHPAGAEENCPSCQARKTVAGRLASVVRYAFVVMPKEIGLEVLTGLVLAALISTIGPVGAWIKSYLARGYGYLFALIFGLIVYMCSTMSVPLIHAFVAQGMNIGAGLGLLILGPIASVGTILVLRKEFGLKILIVFLTAVSTLALLSGYIFSLL
ncbi:MAG: permease [Candidatus Omnitrophica bacterium]|nr:permease [Candidatus Omnitrophota bacterium]